MDPQPPMPHGVLTSQPAPVAAIPHPAAPGAPPPDEATEPGWSAWEQKEFLNANRNWQAVTNFFSALVRGQVSLSNLGLQEPREFDLTNPAPERPAPGAQQQLPAGASAAAASEAAAAGAAADAAIGAPLDGHAAENAAQGAAARRCTTPEGTTPCGRPAAAGEAIVVKAAVAAGKVAAAALPPGDEAVERVAKDSEAWVPRVAAVTAVQVERASIRGGQREDSFSCGFRGSGAGRSPDPAPLMEGGEEAGAQGGTATGSESSDRGGGGGYGGCKSRIVAGVRGGRGGGGSGGGGGVQRRTYKVTVNYFGPAFAGWAYQPGRLTLQGALEAALQPLLGDGDDGTGRVVVSSAGRTDAGVHAAGMPFSFYSWRPLPAADILGVVDSLAPGRLAGVAVQEVPRSFHATFSARWRRYVYLFPLRGPAAASHAKASMTPSPSAAAVAAGMHTYHPTNPQPHPSADRDDAATAAATADFAGAATAAIADELQAARCCCCCRTSDSERKSCGAAAGPDSCCSGCSSANLMRGEGAERIRPPAAGSVGRAAASIGRGPSAFGNACNGGKGGRCSISGRPCTSAAAPVQPPLPPPRPRPSPPAIAPEAYISDPDPDLMGRMLGRLERRRLDFIACARDTPPGKDGACTLHVCRCRTVPLPHLPAPPLEAAVPLSVLPSGAAAAAAADATGASGAVSSNVQPAGGPGGAAASSEEAPAAVRALVVEVVGDRFLRRMVRVLISTALREATPGAGRCGGREGALLECLEAGRAATAMPAPAAGLCFAGAGYLSLAP